jgi:hypothetical protein
MIVCPSARESLDGQACEGVWKIPISAVGVCASNAAETIWNGSTGEGEEEAFDAGAERGFSAPPDFELDGTSQEEVKSKGEGAEEGPRSPSAEKERKDEGDSSGSKYPGSKRESMIPEVRR